MNAHQHASHHSTISPMEFAVIRNVFTVVKSEVWFTDDPARQQRFGAYVVQTYQKGVTDPGKLLAQCRAMAEIKFARKGHSPL